MRLSVLFLVALLGLTSVAVAEPMRVATVDMTRILNESRPAQGKKKELDALQNKKKQQVEERRAMLRGVEQKLKSAGVDEDSKEADDFRSKARDFSRLVKDAEDEIRKEFLKGQKQLIDRALKLIDGYAKTNQISLVLEKSAASKSAVLYGDTAFDITETILRQMNDNS